MPDSDPYLAPLDPATKVRTVAEQSGVSPDIADDYLKLTHIESGQNQNVRQSSKGARGFGQVMPDVRGGTVRTVGGRKYDLTDESQNIEAGLRYFAEGGNDPVGRRLYYFGGPGARAHYQKTGQIPNISDGNMTAAQYVKATGGQQKQTPQDPYLAPLPSQGSTKAPSVPQPASTDPYLAPLDAAPTLSPVHTRFGATAVVPMRRRGQSQQGWGGGGTIGQGLTPIAPVNGMGRPQANGVGGLRELDDPETSRIIRAQRQVSAAQTPFEKRLQLEPGAEESPVNRLRRTENEAVLERVANEKAQEAQAAWDDAHRDEIDKHVAQYRKQIQETGFTKWLTEAQAIGASELLKFGAGTAKSVGATQAANAMRIRAIAAAQAAQEESKDRSVGSKAAQEILGGFAGSAPELLLMQAGVPPVATFAAGGGLRAAGMGQPVVPGITAGALTGAAFEIPAEASGIRPTLIRAGKVGLGTAGVDLATGQPVGQALKSGAINTAMVGVPGLIGGRGVNEPVGIETWPVLGPTAEQLRTPSANAVQVDKSIQDVSPIIRHSDPRIDGGEIIGRTSDGRLKVQNNEGGISVVKDPRRQGNREAAIVKPPEPQTETSLPPNEPAMSTANEPAGVPPNEAATTQVSTASSPSPQSEVGRAEGGATSKLLSSDVGNGLTFEEAAQRYFPDVVLAAKRSTSAREFADRELTEAERADRMGQVRTSVDALRKIGIKGFGDERWNLLRQVGEKKPQGVIEPQPLGGVEAQTKGEPNADISSRSSGVPAAELPVPEAVARPLVEPAKAETPEPSPDTTSIKHAVVEAERELQSLPQFVKARRSHGESFDQGVAAVRNGDIDPRSLAASIVKDPRPLSTKESMALLYDRMRISNAKELAAADLDAAEKSGDAEKISDAYQKVKQLDAASDANDEAVYRAGSEQGRGLAIRRELINRDYSRAVVTAKLKALNKGRDLPSDIQTKVDDLTSRLEQANKRIDDLEKGAGEKQSLAQTDKFVREYKMKLRSQARQRTREVLATERADLKQQFAKLTGSRSVAEFIHSEKGEFDPAKAGEMARVVRDLARNYIEDGVTKAGDIVDSIHAHLKDVSDLSKREVSDLISGYGQIKKTTTDAVEKKLNEVQSILASTSGKADVVEKGIRPLRRGQQRDKPTEDQRRALRELQDAMREQGVKLGEKPYDPETEQATPLDKAKQTTRNRIEQLKSWIASGKKEVQGRQQVIPDSELRQLKAEQAGLEKAAALISDPAADQKAVERRLTELNKSISENQAAIRSGKVKPEVREGARSLWSPEIGAAEKERAALRQIVTDMRADAARKAREAPQPKAGFFGATGSWAEYEAEARKTLNAQKASSQRWAKKVSDMQAELADMQKSGQRTIKPERKVTPDTDEVRVAKRNAKVLQSQIDNLGNVIDWRNKNVFQKGLAYTAAGVRAGLLTGTRTIGKIGSALGQSAAQQYMGEVAGEGARKLFPRTAEMAPRHGQRISGESEGEFIRGVGRGVKDIPRALKSGETSLTLEAGKRYPQIPTKAGTVLAIPGRVHMAEKNILGSGENARAKAQNRQWAEKQRMDVNDPDVKQWIDDAAAKHSDEIMMLGDNPFSRFIRGGRRMLGKEGEDVSRIFVPVERVPSNYLFGQLIGEYGLGLPRGIARGIVSEVRLRRAVKETATHNMDATIVEAAKELERRNPDLMGKLSPEAADKTMRLLKRGSVGLIYMALGGLSGAGAGKVALGGYFGGAGDKNEVKPGDVKVGPVTIPHWALHSPPNELAQFASTLKREIQSQAAQDKGQSLGQRVRTGLATGAKGTAQQVPFLNEYVDAVSSLKNGETMSTQMGKWLAARVEPQIMQELARATDKEETESARRKPRGFTQAMQMGVPGLRERVPFNISPVFSNQPSKGSDEMKRLGVNVRGAVIQPDETPDEYEQRRRTVNYNIQQQTDALVSSPAYDKMSEKDKVEAIRKIPEQVADAYRRTQPRKAAKPRQPRVPLVAAP